MGTSKNVTEKCPVCDYELDSKAKRIEVRGKTIKVCCDECAEKVQANPAKYAAK